MPLGRGVSLDEEGSSLTRLFRPMLLALVAATVLAFAGTTSAQSPRAHAAGTCGIGNSRHYGYSYLTWLWAYKVSCGTARSVARSHGKGWRCHKRILDKVRTQYDAKVSCSASHRRQVQWTYTQNT